MKPTTRRKFIGALAVSGATLAASRANAAPVNFDLAGMKKNTDFACLYHCDFGDPDRFSQMLTNMNNHLSVYEFDPMRIKLVIVAHGAGIKFFLEDLSGTVWEKDKDKISEDLYKRVVGLSKFGVEALSLPASRSSARTSIPARTRKDDVSQVRPVRRGDRRRIAEQGFFVSEGRLAIRLQEVVEAAFLVAALGDIAERAEERRRFDIAVQARDFALLRFLAGETGRACPERTGMSACRECRISTRDAFPTISRRRNRSLRATR